MRTLCPALLIAAALIARADTVEDAWKGLVMQALYAAGANDYAKAELIFQKALHEAERFGAADPRVGTTLNSLGLVYKSEKKYAEAATTFERAGAIIDKAYGPQSIDVANIDYNLASVLLEQGKAQAALPRLQKCLTSYERQFGGESLKTASVLCMIGDSYRKERNFKDAEAPLKRCAQVREADGGMVNADLGEALDSLALVYQQIGKSVLADENFTLAEKIQEKALGITSPALAETLEQHAALLRAMGRDNESQKKVTLAAAIRRTEHKTK